MVSSRIKNLDLAAQIDEDNLRGIGTLHPSLNITCIKSLNEIIVAKDWPFGGILQGSLLFQ